MNSKNIFSHASFNSIKEHYAQKAFLYIESDATYDFGQLMSWEEINRILRQCRLSAPHLNLYKEGKLVSEKLYTIVSPQENGGAEIIETKLYEQLQDGATLVINAIHELSHPLDDFVACLEREFQNSIHVNCYMSWGDNIKGFDTHWDPHDVLILQILGRKHWFVFNETRKFPMNGDLHDEETPPTIPAWEKVIEPGDVLLIPRGQWHHASALNEPSLHLTIGFTCRTGLNYLQWIQDKLIAHEVYRKDIPAFGNPEACRTHQQALAEKLMEVVRDNDLKAYLDDVNANMRPRPYFSLPWAGSSSPHLHDDVCVKLNTPLLSKYEINDAAITFSTRSRYYEFPCVCDFFFQILMDHQSHRLPDLLQASNGKLTRSQLEELISSLVKDGLLAIALE